MKIFHGRLPRNERKKTKWWTIDIVNWSLFPTFLFQRETKEEDIWKRKPNSLLSKRRRSKRKTEKNISKMHRFLQFLHTFNVFYLLFFFFSSFIQYECVTFFVGFPNQCATEPHVTQYVAAAAQLYTWLGASAFNI